MLQTMTTLVIESHSSKVEHRNSGDRVMTPNEKLNIL